ncbi:MAG: SOS response-associated peptidase [Oscillospiraceae bacterium]|jgi:putative SOS response-associated peptidase YedK|nr:SOS response-associated peptidase [Oscillospiraceae bacterium]
MCGRYYISEEDIDEDLLRLIGEAVLCAANDANNVDRRQLKTFGEIFPSDYVPICESQEQKLIGRAAVWGLPINGTNQRVFNTRAETGAEKPMFMRAVPCVVPATCFFEWETLRVRQAVQLGFGGVEIPIFEDKEKIKRSIKPAFKQTGLFFMAGLVRHLPFMLPDYTIITLPASESMEHVHDRMPSVLTEECAREWLSMEKFNREFIFDSSERELVVA